jgi:hypothetical protein
MTKDEARDCDHGRMKGKCEVCDLQAELDATNRQVEILCDALAKSRREIDALVALARADERDEILRMSGSQWFKSQARYDEAIRARGNA